jgi:hypothetical protein
MAHDDMLDCMARIVDPELRAEFPREGRRAAAMPKTVTGSRFADMRRRYNG